MINIIQLFEIDTINFVWLISVDRDDNVMFSNT